MTQASAGMGTSLPTARITPRATTTVAASIGGPETGTIFAPRIAKYCGSPPCAKLAGLASNHKHNAHNATRADNSIRGQKDLMPDSLVVRQGPPNRATVVWTHEATVKFLVRQATARAASAVTDFSF